jgi:hypothetical protein
MNRAAAVALTLIAFSVQPVVGYLKLGFEDSGRTLALSWHEMPVRYYVRSTSVSGVSGTEFQRAITRAFDTWEAVESASIEFEFSGLTTIPPGEADGRSTLGFLLEPALDRVLGATSFLFDLDTGEIIESDIFFNSAFPWAVSTAGTPDRFDVESVALHEIGHLSGLGHSALGETELASNGRRVLAAEAVMFPIAFRPGSIVGRRLFPDDIAGISDIYPEESFTNNTGSVSGRVTKDGRGVAGAHIVAFNPRTGSLVGGFSTDATGEFAIAGLQPGAHVLRVEPLDDGDIESFFEPAVPADLNFRPAIHRRYAIVPRGGDSGEQAIEVEGK